MKTYDDHTRIPNEGLHLNITNYVNNVARRFEYKIRIRYRDDADEAIRLAKRLSASSALKAPMIYVDSLGDNGINLIARIWAPARNWWEVRTVLLWKIVKRLEENGIIVPYPQRTLWLADAERTPGSDAGAGKVEE